MITTTYHSPLGDILLAADDRGLMGLWFADSERPSTVRDAGAVAIENFAAGGCPEDAASPAFDEEIDGHDSLSGSAPFDASNPWNTAAVSVLERTWAWLNAFFAGKVPQWIPPLHMGGSELEQEVRVALLSVPCGSSVSCECLAKRIARRFSTGSAAPSLQDVADAVAHNPIALIVPSHRVALQSDIPVPHLGGRGARLLMIENAGMAGR